jgi:DNA/RNA endonuclease YhcR with UshA esterase domain
MPIDYMLLKDQPVPLSKCPMSDAQPFIPFLRGTEPFAMGIRPFFAILGLLLCAIVARADKPVVIKDSEAINYVGKEVEVRGRVVSVTTSPLGTAFINFGGEYPNQTFAGFIAAGSTIATDQRLTMIQGKTIIITGTIELRDGKPEIKVVSGDQIKGLDSRTER